MSPNSCGAHEMAFTDASCARCAWMVAHCPGGASLWIATDPSYEQLASSTPNLGCAHATSHTGPSCPGRVVASAYWSPCTSHTLTVQSDDAVAIFRL